MMSNHKQILILLVCLCAGIFVFPEIAKAMELEWEVTERYSTLPNPACAIAEDGDYIYIAGYDNSPAGSRDSQWRIEKRRKDNGEILPGGWSVVDNLNVGSVDSKRDEAYAIVADDDPNGFIYVGGISVSTGSSNDQHSHLQKRRKDTGVKVDSYTFDIGDSDSKNWITAMAIDEEYLYLKGIAVTFGRLHIEKRNQSNIRDRDWYVPEGLAGWDRIEEPIIEDGDYLYVPFTQTSALAKYSKSDGSKVDYTTWRSTAANALTADDNPNGCLYAASYDQYTGEIGIGRLRKADAQYDWYTRYQDSDSSRLGIVVDSSHVYLAAADLILKKRISDGKTVSSAAIGGSFKGIAQDDDFIYITAMSTWHIEKWSKKDTRIDIGLRVYNNNISATDPIKIACEPKENVTSALRIARDGDVYGIVLVDPGDSMDSGVRIQTSAGPKALMRFEE